MQINRTPCLIDLPWLQCLLIQNYTDFSYSFKQLFQVFCKEICYCILMVTVKWLQPLCNFTDNRFLLWMTSKVKITKSSFSPLVIAFNFNYQNLLPLSFYSFQPSIAFLLFHFKKILLMMCKRKGSGQNLVKFLLFHPRKVRLGTLWSPKADGRGNFSSTVLLLRDCSGQFPDTLADKLGLIDFW